MRFDQKDGTAFYGGMKMLKYTWKILIVLLLLIWSLPSLARQKYDVHFEDFEEMITKSMAEWDVPGAAIAVMKDDEVVFMDGCGFNWDWVGSAASSLSNPGLSIRCRPPK